eukprot:1199706-Alexandrium_andersonii.AAC.1
MSASLVGSEMCIRDSSRAPPKQFAPLSSIRGSPHSVACRWGCGRATVSYTRLTLPTICSV